MAKTNGNAEEKELKIVQLNAIELLSIGKTDSEVARELGIDRSTIWRWKHDKEFIEKLASRRKELWKAISQSIENITIRALQVLEEIDFDKLREDKKAELAMKILTLFLEARKKGQVANGLDYFIDSLIPDLGARDFKKFMKETYG